MVRHRYLASILLAIAVVLAVGGCKSLLTTIALMTTGTDMEADFPGLKAKKTVVVCKPAGSLQWRDAGAAQDLAGQISELLQTQVPKIKVVDQQKVAAWLDEHPEAEYAEVGKALKAEMVVAVELTDFNIFEGQTLYRGKANANLKVIDLSKGKSQVAFKKTLPQTLYPPNSAIQVSERQEAEFRHEFVSFLADQIARHFYGHDPHADVAADARAGLR